MNTVRPLRVLLVEDSENDATLLELALQRTGFSTQCERVETAEGLAAALDKQDWDVVIADYVMPQFDGLSALAVVKEKGLDLPFIIVSGHITDDTAVAAMKAGAHDYVMKDNLTRLGPAVDPGMRKFHLCANRSPQLWGCGSASTALCMASTVSRSVAAINRSRSLPISGQ